MRKTDIAVAKNYLTEDEIDTLNRLVVIFLETAELRAKGKQETRMAFWKQNVDQIITSNGFPLLTHADTISNEQMEARTGELYVAYDQDRKKREAIQADQQDEAELTALETKIKRRPKKRLNKTKNNWATSSGASPTNCAWPWMRTTSATTCCLSFSCLLPSSPTQGIT